MPPKKDAKQTQQPQAEPEAAFVAVTKDGAEIAIHQSQVEQHIRLGWAVKE